MRETNSDRMNGADSRFPQLAEFERIKMEDMLLTDSKPNGPACSGPLIGEHDHDEAHEMCLESIELGDRLAALWRRQDVDR
jgi:hypothetical protein